MTMQASSTHLSQGEILIMLRGEHLNAQRANQSSKFLMPICKTSTQLLLHQDVPRNDYQTPTLMSRAFKLTEKTKPCRITTANSLLERRLGYLLPLLGDFQRVDVQLFTHLTLEPTSNLQLLTRERTGPPGACQSFDMVAECASTKPGAATTFLTYPELLCVALKSKRTLQD